MGQASSRAASPERDAWFVTDLPPDDVGALHARSTSDGFERSAQVFAVHLRDVFDADPLGAGCLAFVVV